MPKFITATLLCFILTHSFGQTPHKATLYLQGQFSQTIYDATTGNNPWGIGVGLQLFFRQGSKLRPTIDLTADTYLEDDKVLRTYPDMTPIDDLGGMINLFAGVSYHPSETVYVSLVAGPSFTGRQWLSGIKPSLGVYLSQNKKWTGKISYLNVFDREKREKEDFGSMNFSLGMRLF